MKIKYGEEIINNGRKRGSDVIRGIASGLNEAEMIVKIDDLIEARGISQRQLSEMTGIQLGYLSDFILGKTTTINKTHLLALMFALRVDTIEDIVEVRVPAHIKEQFEADRREWIDTKQLPSRVNDVAHLALDIRNKTL